MKIIASKTYLDIAKSYDVQTKYLKTYNGIVDVEENDMNELIININDRWLADMVIVYAETVKTLIGMIAGAKSILESLDLKAEKITKKYYKPDSVDGQCKVD